MYSKEIKYKARILRSFGKSYEEIGALLNLKVPKATMATWYRGVILPVQYREKIKEQNRIHLKLIRKKALDSRRQKREKFFESLLMLNSYLGDIIKNKHVAKIALAMLYLGEGSKELKRASLTFCNSDPRVIKLYMKLIKQCYKTKISKFHCVIQCRADQDTRQLKHFWYNTTGIPLSQFYETRIDKRSIGKVTKKSEYRGVCVIYYYSAIYFYDLLKTIEVITTGP